MPPLPPPPPPPPYSQKFLPGENVYQFVTCSRCLSANLLSCVNNIIYVLHRAYGNCYRTGENLFHQIIFCNTHVAGVFLSSENFRLYGISLSIAGSS